MPDLEQGCKGRTVLVTGAGGFIGSHLTESALERGAAVFSLIRRKTANVQHFAEGIVLYQCDLLRRERLAAIVASAKPDIVLHLAAQSLVLPSWQDPEQTFRINVFGTLYLLEALRKASLDPLVLVAGSSAAYGSVPADQQPISEERPLNPSSPYGLSKVALDLLARLYGQTFGLRLTRFRPFFIIGPRKRDDACSDFARGIVQIEQGLRSDLPVGNLQSVRDFLDVRDMVGALWLLVEKGTPGEVYNICSGRGYRMADVLEKLIALARCPILVRADPARLRPLDEPMVVGDNTRLRRLGWHPQIPLDQSLAEILDFWRQTLSGRRGQR